MAAATAIPTCPTRQDLLAQLPKGGRIAEIGVFAGAFAADILRICDPSELHLIDPWTGALKVGDQHGKHFVYEPDLGVLYERLRRQYAGHPVVRLHRGLSGDVLPRFGAHYFDAVYIDGDHSEAGCRQDLALSAVASRGVIAGHDYHAKWFPGIIRAVTEFCAATEWRLTKLTEDGCPSFLLERSAAR